MFKQHNCFTYRNASHITLLPTLHCLTCCVSDLCEDVDSKHKLSEIIDELAERKKQPPKQAKSSGAAALNVTPTPTHRHGRRLDSSSS